MYNFIHHHSLSGNFFYLYVYKYVSYLAINIFFFKLEDVVITYNHGGITILIIRTVPLTIVAIIESYHTSGNTRSSNT